MKTVKKAANYIKVLLLFIVILLLVIFNFKGFAAFFSGKEIEYDIYLFIGVIVISAVYLVKVLKTGVNRVGDNEKVVGKKYEKVISAGVLLPEVDYSTEIRRDEENKEDEGGSGFEKKKKIENGIGSNEVKNDENKQGRQQREESVVLSDEGLITKEKLNIKEEELITEKSLTKKRKFNILDDNEMRELIKNKI